MGFCLFNNVAVAATALADAGERVLIVDYDAHHGNGTQDIFYRDPRVLFVSFHQWPCYPGTGRVDETGEDEGLGTTVNIPLPAGATGDVYVAAWERVVMPAVDAFGPTWVLISATLLLILPQISVAIRPSLVKSPVELAALADRVELDMIGIDRPFTDEDRLDFDEERDISTRHGEEVTSGAPRS